MKEKKTDLC